MIKMNFHNQLEDDDKHLIDLLKEEFKEFPSDGLVERTMHKISAMQAERRFVYKPLRTPLYIMLVMVVVLLVPFFAPMISNSSDLNPLSELLIYRVPAIYSYSVWCWLAIVVLLISSVLLSIRLKLSANSLSDKST